MFSVVIPLYNKEESIRNTIQSVLDQTCQLFEVVVVNDGSTDSSVEVVEQINDVRIRVIHQENQGVSAARNRGIQEAVYDWVAFLDGDDLWNDMHLQVVKEMVQEFPDEKVFATCFEYSDKRPLFRHARSENITRINNYFQEALRENLIWTGVVTIHKSCIAKVGGFNEKLSRGEDLDLWARLARDYSVIKSQVVTATYNVSGEGSLSAGKSVYSKSILSVIDLKYLKSYERKYFKRMIYRRLVADLIGLDFIDLFKLIKQHNIEILIP